MCKEENIEQLEQHNLEQIANVTNSEELENLRIKLFGKNGHLTELLKSLGKMTAELRQEKGPKINKLKNSLLQKIAERAEHFKQEAKLAKLRSEQVDISLSVVPYPVNEGRLHPLSQVSLEITKIFAKFGFSVAGSSDIETDYYNFTALNFPLNHPAREMHDTFFLKAKDDQGKAKLLRTHTSPGQIHSMLASEPPLRIILPGKTYRMDEDATHSPMFHQLEGLVIEEGANMAHLRWILEEFCKEFFCQKNIKMRFRPSFFPFTEPSMEVDINCRYIDNELHIGEGDKWLEILGCGMVHPNVLTAGNIDATKYQGFAWGMGLERVAMLKYGIKDLRNFFNSDINWLRHYGFKAFSNLQILNNEE